MAEVIKTDKLINLLKKYKINFPRKALFNYVKTYGIEKADELEVIRRDKRSPNYSRKEIITSGIYKQPSDKKLKEIKKQYDINRLKASGTTEEGAKAFTKRKTRAEQLLKKGYSQTEANEVLKKEFTQFKDYKNTLKEVAKDLRKQGVEIKSGSGPEGTQTLRVRDDLSKLNKSEVKDLIRSGETNINKIVSKTQKILNLTPELAARRVGQLMESFAGDNQYINAKSGPLAEKSKSLITGLGEISKSKLYGGIGGGLQRQMANRNVAASIGKSANFFNSLKKRIQESLPGSNFETDEIKNIMSSSRNRTGPYSIFLQGLRPDINQDKVYELDRQMGSYEKRIQQTEDILEKKNLAKEFNIRAKEFVADANKNLKPGQLPVRALEFSFDEPSKVIKNKNALENYGELFDDIYKKHGYSFKVPADVKTVDEIKPFLQDTKGNTKALKALAQKAPRIFGIPAAAYLGYQALSPSAAEAKTPSPIQDTQTAMQDQAVEGQVLEPKLASPIKYDQYAGFVSPEDTNQKASQSDLLYWIADNEIPEEVQEVGKIVGEAAAVIGGATVGLGLPDAKKTIEEARIAGKSPVKGVLGKGFYRLGSPLATAAFTIPQVLDEDTTFKDIGTDPLNYLGLATMETLGKRAGTIAALAAVQATGIMGTLKNYATLKNVGEAIPGKLSAALRLGLNPRVIAGASRFLGIPGLIASTGYSLYDYLSNKDKEAQ
jgi:hypothetical protein